MSWNNKVIWTEGLFLRPQHFQQQDRFVERYVESRSGGLRSYSWGFTELTIDQDLLAIGKLAIASARGVFPDGTPFNIPVDDDSPPPLEIGEDLRDTAVYLSLPVRQPGVVEVVNGAGTEESLARYQLREHEARDVSAVSDGSAEMQVGSLRVRLLLEKDHRAEYACLGIAHVIECRVDKNVVLDESYIPPMLDVHATSRLAGFVSEVQGLLHHRGQALAGRVAGGGKAAAEIADFLLLQVVNRNEPMLAHLAAGHLLHPEELYRLLVGLAGELSTMLSESRRPPKLATYRHDALKDTFEPVMAALRECLSKAIDSPAVPLPLKEKRYGIRVAQINDLDLVDQANFVLAVHADLPVEELQRRLPTQIKIGSVENIRELVNVQLPGIRIRPLPVAPRQIPYHADNVYFELDRSSEYWSSLKGSGGFAIHVGGEFPGLSMEFWAIRG